MKIQIDLPDKDYCNGCPLLSREKYDIVEAIFSCRIGYLRGKRFYIGTEMTSPNNPEITRPEQCKTENGL